MILVDSNVLLDLVTNDAKWGDWSERQLEAAAARGKLFTSPVVFAELSVAYPRLDDVDAFLSRAQVVVEETPRLALFLVGKAFRAYRRQGGQKTGVLPDFFIGAQAQVVGAELLTRDPARFRTYFPNVRLIAP